jgi:alkylhydroperoxidase family enzyme
MQASNRFTGTRVEQGESVLEPRIIDAWEESPCYTERERAALAWTEALTNLREGHVPDDVYDRVRQVFNERELADLRLASWPSTDGTV